MNVAEQNLINILYCITARPRLFRWNHGVLEWRPKWHPFSWGAVPVVLTVVL